MIALAVSGERKRGGRDPVQPGDAWHIGSNTKMLTALAYARLVEAGHARWGMTLAEIFAGGDIEPGWSEVTIEDLLAHRSGAAPNPGTGAMLGASFSKKAVVVQRAELVASTLKQKPPGKRGEFVYSNFGYIIAGRVIEKLAEGSPDLKGLSYEQLLKRLVILRGRKGAGEGFGFGPPLKGIQGHKKTLFGGVKPAGTGAGSDNPAVFASAGTGHVSLSGHALLLLPFLGGPDALPAAMRDKLLAPYPDNRSDYALGWGVAEIDPAGKVFTHNGSNTMWFSQVTLAPDLGVVIIVNANQYDEAAMKAVSGLTRTLLGKVSERR